MRKYARYIPIAVMLLVLPHVVPNRYALHVLIYIFMYAALALAWDLIGGIGGQLSLGHATFFGIGSYTGVLLLLHRSIPPVVSLPIAMVVCALAALIIGLPAFRLHGVFFVMTTIAFSEIFRVALLTSEAITEGARGLNIPFMAADALFLQFEERDHWYYLVLGVFVFVAAIHARISRSRLGYELRAVREDEVAARAYGIRSDKVKLVAFAISAAITAAIGVLSAFYIGYIDPYSVAGIPLSIKIAVMSIVGGRDSTVGGLVGAAVIIGLEEMTNAWFGQFAGLNIFLYGVLIIAVVLLAPRGVTPVLAAWGQRAVMRFRSAQREGAVGAGTPLMEGKSDPKAVSHR